MSTVLTLQINSTNSEATELLGRQIGANLKGGEVLVLSSDLGGGKTTLTRGIVAGTGSDDAVASPTFTISKVYTAPQFEIHHFDFYRLSEPGIIAHELAEVAGSTDTVCIIEWADVVKDQLPSDFAQITIEQTGDEARAILISVPKSLSYITEGIST